VKVLPFFYILKFNLTGWHCPIGKMFKVGSGKPTRWWYSSSQWREDTHQLTFSHKERQMRGWGVKEFVHYLTCEPAAPLRTRKWSWNWNSNGWIISRKERRLLFAKEIILHI
jgi:hypothetical protein